MFNYPMWSYITSRVKSVSKICFIVFVSFLFYSTELISQVRIQERAEIQPANRQTDTTHLSAPPQQSFHLRIKSSR
jgi:hypothetical protein